MSYSLLSICKIPKCGRTKVARGWCSKHWQRWRKYGDPLGGGRSFPNPEEAFEARTMPEPNSGCLLWIGGVNRKGYGAIRVKGKFYLAHRYAWEQEHGPIPEGLVMDHICHTPACVNVDHLRLATLSQNNMNRSRLQKNNKSGVHGVHWSKARQKWMAGVSISGSYTYLGYFDDLGSAEKAVREKRKELFGEFSGRV